MSKILIVDDDENILKLLTKWLELETHEVVPAINGQQAMDIMESEDFDLVVTDIVMPEKEGIELIVNVRRRNEQIPIIAMSGAGQNRDAYLSNAKKLGASRVLTKPIDRDFFIGTVNEVLK
jgi:DNA-binding NtrC family response regulator